MKSTTLTLSIIALLALSATAAMAQSSGSVSIRVGSFEPAGESDIWTDNMEDLTFEIEDFKGGMGGVEVSWFLSDTLAIAFAIDGSSKTVLTEYRSYIALDGFPIEQELELKVVPITSTIKYMPLGNGTDESFAIVPWIGGGIGIYAFEYRETGEFIDFTDMSVLETTFLADEEAGLGAHLAFGLALVFDDRFEVSLEIRRSWASADLGEDFTGFEPIDLGGVYGVVGAGYRF